MNSSHGDVTWQLVDVYVWTILESSVGITSACLPTLREYKLSLIFYLNDCRVKKAKVRFLGTSFTDHRIPDLLIRKAPDPPISTQRRLNLIVLLRSLTQEFYLVALQRRTKRPG